MWVASMATVTHVIQARQKYVQSFRNLRQANYELATFAETAMNALSKEHTLIVESVRNAIRPELELISREVIAAGKASEGTQLDDILKLIDRCNSQTLRVFIEELESDEFEQESLSKDLGNETAPKFQANQLSLNPSASLKICLVVGSTLLLPVANFQIYSLWLFQIFALFTPVFILQIIRTRVASVSSLPNLFWVLAACIFSVTLRVTVIPPLPQIAANLGPRSQPVLSAGLIALSILLGAYVSYFKQAYEDATQQQEVLNLKLAQNLNEIEIARQHSRKTLSRLLHGPVQGRLAAVRIKLRTILDRRSESGAGITETEIGEILNMLDRIDHEILKMSASNLEAHKTNFEAEFNLIQRNWQGLIEISMNLSAEAGAILEQDSLLSQKVVAACAEAITNASRHGNAKRIDILILLTEDSNSLSLTVQDDGTGIKDSIVAGIGLTDIEADGARWTFEPSESGAKLQITFQRILATNSINSRI